MVLTDRQRPSFVADNDAREAFAAAAIGVYQLWAPLSPQERDAGVQLQQMSRELATAQLNLNTAHANADARQEALKEAKRQLRSTEEELTVIKEHLRQATDNLKRKCEECGVLDSCLKERAAYYAELESKAGDICLCGSGWVQFKDRKPTLEDADLDGVVNCMGTDGVMFQSDWDATYGQNVAHWRPTNSPVPVPAFVQWKRSLTENEVARFGGPCNLDEVWKSIQAFNQKHPT